MRLFLTSAGIGGRVAELTDLVGEGARVAVTANALDVVVGERERADWLGRELAALEAAGCSAAELDLRELYDRPGAVDGVLDEVDLVWATGGNVFVLRDAFRRSGLDAALLDRLRADRLAYGGSSAGACVCAPTLAGFELIDEADAAGEPIFDGLGLFPFSIAPHSRTPGEVGETIDRLVDHFRRSGTPYRALRDGEAIVVRDGIAVDVDVPRPA